METIQTVLDKELLQAADQAARQTKQNRSALVRDALREHLRRLETRAREERDRQGYATHTAAPSEFGHWEAEAAWPPEQPVAISACSTSPRRTKGGPWSS